MLDGLYVPNTPTLIGDLGVQHTLTETGLGRTGQALRDNTPIDLWIVISPHFVTTGGFGIVSQPNLRQLHDFSGFPREFYQKPYKAMGSPLYAGQLEDLARKIDLPAAITTEWGLDHGAWAPLLHLMPQPTIPVLPVSICPMLGPQAHEQLGALIAQMSQGHRFVLMATGSLVHRLDLWSQHVPHLPPNAGAYRMAAIKSFETGQWSGLWEAPEMLQRDAAPEGGELPLRVLAGALPQFRAEVVAQELEFNAVSLDSVRFWAV
jgi:4,5-DOPA dioxygenase extradiol